MRMLAPPEVLSGPMIWVSILGLFTNLAAVKILHSSAKHSLNMRGAYMEVFSDMIGSAGVLVAALTISFTGWFWVDALVSALIGLLIIPRTWSLLKESVNILMEGTPSHIDTSELAAALKGLPGVVDVHDLHVWTITSGLDSMSAHMRVNAGVSSTDVLEAVHELLERKFDIRHSTVQIELVDCNRGCQCVLPAKSAQLDAGGKPDADVHEHGAHDHDARDGKPEAGAHEHGTTHGADHGKHDL
jgi:cobalt-zinc-cadmium efflux system protein